MQDKQINKVAELNDDDFQDDVDLNDNSLDNSDSPENSIPNKTLHAKQRNDP